MARIAGINIPMNKHVWVGLRTSTASATRRRKKACAAAGVKLNTLVKDLTEAEVDSAALADRQADGRRRSAPRSVHEHQAPDGPRLLPRHPSSSRPAAARPAHAHQRPHPQGSAQGGGQDERACRQGIQRLDRTSWLSRSNRPG